MAAARTFLALVAFGLVVSCSDSSTAPGYTIGGTVTGLSSAGLVLQNNGGNNRAVSASGNYTFSTGLADGAAYNVTILTQPAFQNCTVSNATGTVAGANITNVTVTCTTPSFTLGGAVSGLVGLAGLVLQNNSGNDLPVATNGNFSFGSMPSGSAYSITVSSPAFSRDTCIVGNGSGTVGKANVSNITVTCFAPFAGHEVVTSSVTTGAIGTLGTAAVICPGSKRALSGGYRSQSGEAWRVWRSRPVDAGGTQTGDRGWAISFVSVVAGQSVTVHAVCATPGPNMSYEVVTASAATGNAGTLGAVTVPCPGARRALGGGYSSENAAEVWRIGRNRGEGSGAQATSWTVDFTSVTAGQNVSAHAACSQAPQDLGYEVVTANTTTGTAGNVGTVSAFCPSTKRVMGGGFTSVSAAEVWRVWRNYPVDAGVQVGDRGWAVDFTSVVAGQTVSAYAICAFAPN